MRHTTSQLHKWMLPIIFILFAMMAGVFFLTLGIRKGNDTAWYLRGAQDLLAGKPLSERQVMYSGFIFLVAFLEWIGAGLTGVVIIQIILAAVAGFCIYRLGRAFDGEHWTGLIAAALFLLNPDIMFWHFYQLTDSLYISMVVISTWIIYNAHVDGKISSYLLAALTVLITALIRPNGWIFVPLAVLYLFLSRRTIKKKTKILVLMACGAVFLISFAMLPAIRDSAGQWFLNSQRFSEGVTIYGYKDWRVPMPDDANIETEGLASAWTYILRHPFASLGLVMARVLAELAHIRPYFSLRHNIAVVFTLYPLYALAVMGMPGAPNKNLSYLMLSIIGIHLMIIGMTWAIWEGRFLLYFLPLIFVYSAHAIERNIFRRMRLIQNHL